MTSTAALLTPPGPAAIAVIRLAGPLNAAFAAAHLTRPPRGGRCVHCDLRDGDTVIDDVVVVETETGALDLNVHGGPWVVEATLQLVGRFGYALSSWRDTPSSLDAADEVERQMLLDLPAAQSIEVIRLLAAQPAAWRAMLRSPDAATLQRAINDTALARALTTPTVAIVGPPNVGKSTLANALFGRDRSITADRPGTTRDWVGELADVDGLVVRLIDTPGVRETDDVIESAAIEAAGREAALADLIILVVDGSVAFDASWHGRLARVSNESATGETPLQRRDRTPANLVVRTKSDRPVLCKIDCAALGVCAPLGHGLDLLRTMIRTSLGCVDLTSPHARCWTDTQRYTLRQRLDAAAASI